MSSAHAESAKRVLHLIDTGGPGGAETVFRDLVSGLQQMQFLPIAVVSRDDWLAEKLRDRGVEPIILNAAGRFNFSYLRELINLVRREGVDLICTHLLGSAVYGSLAGLVCRKPVVCIFHGQSDVKSVDRIGWLKRLAIRWSARRVVFVSTTLRNSQGKWLGLPMERTATIYNGIDFERFDRATNGGLRAQYDIEDGVFLAGAVGNLRPAKSYDVLLQATRLIQDRHPEFRLLIIGQGSGKLYDELVALRQKLGLDAIVKFLGLREDVPSILRSLDVYVLSSTTEGFSIACVEAMACGLPIVATRSGGPEEILINERTGLLVATESPQELADAACRIIRDHDLARRLGATAKKDARLRFSQAQMLASYQTLLLNILRT